MATREQQRALTAHHQVAQVPGDDWDKYRTATLKAQALIRNAGLCQALHFLQNKDKEGGSKHLVSHLYTHLVEGHAIPIQCQEAEFLALIREAQLPAYLAATRETLQCLTWQCRMVEARNQQMEAGVQ